MKKQIVRTLSLDDEVVKLAEPIYIDVKGKQFQVLTRVIVELNNQVKKLKEELNAN